MPHNAPRSRPFMQCDVFSTHPTGGNGLAVVLDGEGLSTEQMQAFARWTNLAETTFVLPPSDPAADYDIRIFTTAREMEFAGHPTLGTAQCWLAAGNTPMHSGKIVQNCGVGLVDIDLTGDVPAFVAPPTQIAAMPDADLAKIKQALGTQADKIARHSVLDNGPVWHAIELQSADDVLALDIGAFSALKGLAVGLIAPHASGDVDFEVRMFSMWGDTKEDPITGSLNAALAHWFQDQGRADAPYMVAQGTQIGRVGRVHVIPTQSGQMKIGGHTNILIEGQVTL